jgi:hypothetical protein
MKISVANFCVQCNEESQKLGKEYTPEEKLVFAELNELGIYNYQCPNGHQKKMILKKQLFQILFDLGALALSDSYTREAVSSFTSALERFYEFIIKIIAFSDNMEEEILDGFWNQISKLSERQLGAYVSLYSYKFKKNPHLPERTWVEFRNDVIHKGIIPNSTKTLEFGQKVADIILSTLSDVKKYLKNDFRKSFAQLESFQMKKIEKKFPNINNVSISFIKTIIDFNFDESVETKEINLDDIIDNLKKTKSILPYVK